MLCIIYTKVALHVCTKKGVCVYVDSLNDLLVLIKVKVNASGIVSLQI